MRVVLLLFLTITVGAQVFDSLEPTIEGATNEDGKEGNLHNGFDIELDAVDTKKFLERLHDMEDEINNELSLSEEQNAELMKKMEDYVEIKKDHVEPMGDTIEEINHNNNVDTALFQGDMILTKEQTKEAIEDIKENEGSRRKRQAFRDENYPKTLWPNGSQWKASIAIIPQMCSAQAARRVFRKATVLWSLDTCINFKESSRAADRITVIAGTGCYSFVGRTGGVQILSLGKGCEMVGIAAHEIGHALGFFHTQSRHDRDQFITLYKQNFLPGWLSQFTKQTKHTNYNYNLTYDYGSIMHYGATVSVMSRMLQRKITVKDF
uniref:Metalloendopeptidase n=1 Tax=Angiostrongylus cantonensis TaxID=6313 RepID=A0A0K0DFA3_ANGCA